VEEKPLKILIVDDNPDYLFTMETFLKSNGFETLTAEDGKTAMERIRTERPDMVLLDVMMETRFSGFEVCKKIRTDPELEETLIISITGMAEELGVGFDKYPDYHYFSPDEFMEKPVDKPYLLKRIREIFTETAALKKRPKWQKDLEAEQIKKYPGTY
jgi:two-component system alkaline phosphatase synthesis response regulator PhoP